MASILAKRNQSAQVRTAQRTAAIQKAKSEKKEVEAKKTKVRFRRSPHHIACTQSTCEDLPASWHDGTQDLKAAGKGWKGWPLVGVFLACRILMFCRYVSSRTVQNAFTCTREDRAYFPVNLVNISEVQPRQDIINYTVPYAKEKPIQEWSQTKSRIRP